MTDMSFIGGGRVTRILLGGWAHAGATPLRVLVHEPDDTAFVQLSSVCPDAKRATIEEAASAAIVFLALHPPKIPDVLRAIGPILAPGAILVSLAPKVTIGELAAESGTVRIARMIPNAPSIVGQGYNPVAFAPGLDTVARAALTDLLRNLGQAPEVEERQLEAYAIVTAMGPTYFWFQWEALRRVAEGLGLGIDDTSAAVRAMLTGAVATLFDSGLPPAAVMDLVPVKPLALHEHALGTAYHEVLTALHAKLAPAGGQAALASSLASGVKGS